MEYRVETMPLFAKPGRVPADSSGVERQDTCTLGQSGCRGPGLCGSTVSYGNGTCGVPGYWH